MSKAPELEKYPPGWPGKYWIAQAKEIKEEEEEELTKQYKCNLDKIQHYHLKITSLKQTLRVFVCPACAARDQLCPKRVALLNGLIRAQNRIYALDEPYALARAVAWLKTS